MEILVKKTERYGRITLTTESPLSHYNVPVLRLEDHNWPDLGPRDLLPTGITAAEFVVRHASSEGASEELVSSVQKFISQWPNGPKLTAKRIADEREAMWEENKDDCTCSGPTGERN